MNLEPIASARALGIDPQSIRSVEALSERHGHAILRIVTTTQSYVLKWLPSTDARVEIQGTLLLQSLGVPTLPIYGQTEQALLMEDLTRSETWRLATEADLRRPDVGRAVARWYRTFHRAGETMLAKGEAPDFLKRETDALTPESIKATGRALGLTRYPVWDFAGEQITLLKAAIDRLGITLNYNDFYYTNLALSRRESTETLKAIVFDYHLLGIGMRTSDCRNATGALSEEAARAFWDTYGSVDPREAALDRPLATLYGLHVASRMETFPRWADSSRERVLNGLLKEDLTEAAALARSLVETTTA